VKRDILVRFSNFCWTSLATERLLEIEANFEELVESFVPVDLDGEMLRLVLYVKNGTNLRVTEQWDEPVYSMSFRTKYTDKLKYTIP
jgi:hypothetical protein